MLRSRAAIYFEEVARRGSIRRASESLHIAASAIDRQIIALEQHYGVPLFERTPQGLKLTSAGELLVELVRRWRRDADRLQAQIDDLRGLRRGNVSIAAVEGAASFLSRVLHDFNTLYPQIEYQLQVTGSQAAVSLVLNGGADIGLTFNPPEMHALRVERTLIYQLGVVVPPDHPLAGRKQVGLADCARYPLVVPDETISLRPIIDQVWQRHIGQPLMATVTANSTAMLRSLVLRGLGIGFLTEIDVLDELRSDNLRFIALADKHVPLSVLSVISASGRTLSKPAALLMSCLSDAMTREGAPTV